MPYKKIADLPKPVKEHLPKHAQEIYKEAFNHAFDEYKSGGRDGSGREETAHRVAWMAVKKKYEKQTDGKWHKKI